MTRPTPPAPHLDAGSGDAVPAAEAPSSPRRHWPGTVLAAGLWMLLVVLLLLPLGMAVAEEVERMSQIQTEICAPPRTSWVPFLQIELLSCLGDVPPPPSE